MIKFHILLLPLMILCQCSKKHSHQNDSHTTTRESQLELLEKTKGVNSESLVAQQAIPTETPELQNELGMLIDRWDKLSSQVTGRILISKQRELAYEAIGLLAGGPELTQFLQFLKNKGAADLHQEIIDVGMVDLFRGEKSQAMREWLLRFDDLKVKERLMLQAGMAYYGEDIGDFFELVGQFPNGHNCQCSFITGYCATMAKNDPLGAMKFYANMCHPKRIDNSGLAKVMEYVPSNADFLSIATEIKEDSAGLSKSTRRSLLNNWSKHKPSEAAQYVMSNTSVVHADQMAVVMKQWAQQDPEQAAAWIAGWDSSDHKDQGCLILAQTMKLAKPADAFVMASQISNFELKVKTATEAFNQWVKTDRKAAEAAWLQVFPQ